MNGFKNWLQLQERIMVGNKEFRDPLPALKEIAKNHPNPDNLVVTFTAIDKVGINPKSDHDTPIGIYFYPIKYVIDKKMEVPFMGDQPYINVCEFTRPDKILRIKSGGTQGMDNPKLKSLPGFEDVQKTPIRSKAKFINVIFSNESTREPLTIKFDKSYFQVGNEVLSAAHVLLLLNSAYTPSKFVFDTKYELKIMDGAFNLLVLKSNEWIQFDDSELGYVKKTA